MPPAFVHKLAGQHEKRHGHQGEAIHAVVDVAIQQSQITLLTVKHQNDTRCCQHAKEHRQSDEQKQQEQRQKPYQH